MCPWLGRTAPATARRVWLFPEPDGPMSAVIGAWLANATSSVNPRYRLTIRTSSIGASPPTYHEAQREQHGERQDGEDGREHERRVEVTLERGVDGQRHGLSPALETAREHDGGAELAQ